MTFIKKICLIALIFLSFPACVFSEPLELTDKDSGKEFSLPLNKSVVITLPENPTTGYSWQFTTDSRQQNLISDLREESLPPHTDLVGAGGKKQITFKTQAKGMVKIRGFYARPWEKDTPPVKEVSYTFNIE